MSLLEVRSMCRLLFEAILNSDSGPVVSPPAKPDNIRDLDELQSALIEAAVLVVKNPKGILPKLREAEAVIARLRDRLSQIS